VLDDPATYFGGSMVRRNAEQEAGLDNHRAHKREQRNESTLDCPNSSGVAFGTALIGISPLSRRKRYE
jgi:hypothetical protein